MNYNECLEFLFNSLQAFHDIGAEAYKPGFENINALEKHLGEPHRKFSSVHIAGTNGKGSTSHMVASVLAQAGYKTGLFTSPHLIDFRERIKVNGQMISEQEVVEFVQKNAAIIDEIKPSFFEITTAMAFDHFARKGVEVAVVETGLGGRLDSTNIIRPLVSVITNISHDHSEFLGESIEQIAGQKAGIIKELTPVVIGESLMETKLLFINRAKKLSSPIIFADCCYRVLSQEATSEGQRFEIENLLDGLTFTIDSDLGGGYQRKNILTALSTLDMLNGAGGLAISPEAVKQGIAIAAQNTGLMGRWQVIGQSPLVVADTGHNEGGIEEIVKQIEAQSFEKLIMVIGFAREKDLSRVLPLLPLQAHYIFTQASVQRAMEAEKLRDEAARYSLQGEAVADVVEAYRKARSMAQSKDMIFVGGSTFVVSDLLAAGVAAWVAGD